MTNFRLPAIALITCTCASGFASELFVAPGGSDENPGTRAKPFASFYRAQEAVREERRAHPGAAVTVTFQAGVYHLYRPVEFTQADSGASEALPITYRARPGADAVIDGGRAIQEWQADPDHAGLWKTRALPEGSGGVSVVPFNQLWVNGNRAIRARSPNYWEFSAIKNVTEEPAGGRFKHTFKVAPGALSALRGLDDIALHQVQIVVFHKWDTTREPVDSASLDEGLIVTHGTKMQPWNGMDKESVFYLENYPGALDAPGEWFLDRAGWLYYRPRPGEDLAHIDAVAPVAERFLSVQGNPEKPEEWVQHIRFDGLKFRHAEFRIPADGLPPGQAAMNIEATAIQLNAARDIRFNNCAVEHIGMTAFWFRHACRDCTVEHTRIFDVGMEGVRIGEPNIVPEPVRTGFVTITNCIIQTGGQMMPHAVAFWIGQNSDNTLAHCDVGDFFYTAVSVGWRWGYDESTAKRNHIEFNHLHHLGYRILSDMGGVYTLGPSEGTTVRNNVIHDVYAAHYGGWGLYPDEGSTGILYENNLVYNVRDGCIHQHYGKENVFRNNILAFSDEGQIALTRAEPHLSFTFEHNLVYWDKGSLLGYAGWKNGAKVVLHDNLYWRTGGRSFDLAGKTWEEWRAGGRDEGSIIADPLFVAPENHDFRLRPGSPAEKIGFHPIDFSQAGVQGKAWRRLASAREFPKPYAAP